MTEVKGKFITLTCSLLVTKPEAKKAALQIVKDITGKEFNELDPDGWYTTEITNEIVKAIGKHSSAILTRAAVRLIGEKVYPTIKKTMGLPKNLNTPLDFIKHEGIGFLENNRGIEIKERKIISAQEGKVIISATSPYDCLITAGVYLGILKMCNADDAEVSQTKCVKNGDSDCEFLIRWKV